MNNLENTKTIYIGSYGAVFVKDNNTGEVLDYFHTVEEAMTKYPKTNILQLLFDPKTELVCGFKEMFYS